MRLRPLRADAADVRAVMDAFTADPAEMFRQGEVTDEDSARAYVERLLRPMMRTAVIADPRDRLLGLVGVSIDAGNRLGWFFYWLHPAHRGAGLMSRAAREVADRALAPEPEGWGLERLELGHRANNPASGAVARAAGFVQEGREREKFLVEGERIDVLTYGRLRSDPAPDAELLDPALAVERLDV
ncbi:hypothetical protein GCM10009793_28130 [Brachybacterium phenoliresistens]|uniref:GCN5 family acetyltransferase n=2 Tax=Brachybacterium phenoliresistens TaxID=396014 RepID=Z9JN69_9MICO|nr:GCN5 family acetyltransferase [Brachybacterium phenoliresistens]